MGLEWGLLVIQRIQRSWQSYSPNPFKGYGINTQEGFRAYLRRA